MRKQKKLQKLVITGRPKHRHFAKGVALSWRSSHNLFLRTVGYGEISEPVLKAFRKALLHKHARKLFIFRAHPFLELTKKPQEVRMGKGRGTKIQKRIFPYVPGQILVEVNTSKRPRLMAACMFSLQKAAKKLPFRTHISIMDL
jgi:ribosomal protein L16/L10AE